VSEVKRMMTTKQDIINKVERILDILDDLPDYEDSQNNKQLGKAQRLCDDILLLLREERSWSKPTVTGVNC
jgi:hypothetical protein